MKTDIQDLKEGVRDARRALDSKCEEAMESLQQMQGFSRVLEAAEQMLDENVRLREDLEELQEQLLEEKDLRTKADMLAERLGIANKWKFFEKLWHRNNMRSDYNTALDQRKSLEFQERLKHILG